MTKWQNRDWESTKEVVAGERPATEKGKTWLRHSKDKKDGSCYKIDLEILKGTSSVEEIAKAVGCKVSRVVSHLDHLQEEKDKRMEPHHLRIKKVDGKIMFDVGGNLSKNRERERLEAIVRSDIESIDAEQDEAGFFEGEKKQRLVNFYERKPELRAQTILHHGKECKVCGFDFEKVYGERGRDYIEVHHLRPISSLDGKQQVNPATDMTVLCANCHRMIHRMRENLLSPEELKQLINLNAKMQK